MAGTKDKGKSQIPGAENMSPTQPTTKMFQQYSNHICMYIYIYIYCMCIYIYIYVCVCIVIYLYNKKSCVYMCVCVL